MRATRFSTIGMTRQCCIINLPKQESFIGKRTERLLSTGIVLLIMLSITGFLWTASSILLFPFSVDYGEGPLGDQSLRILAGQPIYKADIASPPYVIANYPPLFPLLQAGVSAASGLPVLLSGRLISLLASLICAMMLAWLGKSITKSWIAGVAAAGFFLGHPHVTIWSAFARVDLLALALSVAALLVVYRHWRSWRWIGVAIGLLLASIYTRQSYLLAGPLAASVWLWQQDRRRSIVLAGNVGLGSALLFMLFNTLTQGGFYANIILANVNLVEFARLGTMFRQQFLIWPFFLLMILGTILYILAQHKREATTNDNWITDGLVPYTIGALLASLTVSKVGSDVNYFLELIAAGAVWMAVLIYKLQSGKPAMRIIFYSAIICQLIWLLAGGYVLNKSYVQSRWENIEQYEQLAAQMRNATAQGQVLSDDYLGMIVQAGQQVYYAPFEYGQLYQAGHWNPAELAAQIQARAFPLIVIGGDTLDKPCCWPPELVQAIREQYTLEYYPRWIVCTPRR